MDTKTSYMAMILPASTDFGKGWKVGLMRNFVLMGTSETKPSEADARREALDMIDANAKVFGDRDGWTRLLIFFDATGEHVKSEPELDGASLLRLSAETKRRGLGR